MSIKVRDLVPTGGLPRAVLGLAAILMFLTVVVAVVH